jgi:methionyl-tRNA formyltransferase
MVRNNVEKPIIILATPHTHNDSLEKAIKEKISELRVIRLKSPGELNYSYLETITPEIIFFPHWSWFIPEEIYTQFECIVFHMTDLPYGRGGSPLQNLIVRGHTETHLSALRCEAGLDTGPIYLKRPLSLEGTAEEILQRASALMEEMIITIVEERPMPTPQTGDPVLFKRRNPEDGNLDQISELPLVYDYIRMLDGEGYSNAFLQTEHFQFDFSDAKNNGDYVDAKVRIRRRLE